MPLKSRRRSASSGTSTSGGTAITSTPSSNGHLPRLAQRQQPLRVATQFIPSPVLTPPLTSTSSTSSKSCDLYPLFYSDTQSRVTVSQSHIQPLSSPPTFHFTPVSFSTRPHRSHSATNLVHQLAFFTPYHPHSTDFHSQYHTHPPPRSASMADLYHDQNHAHAQSHAHEGHQNHHLGRASSMTPMAPHVSDDFSEDDEGVMLSTGTHALRTRVWVGGKGSVDGSGIGIGSSRGKMGNSHSARFVGETETEDEPVRVYPLFNYYFQLGP